MKPATAFWRNPVDITRLLRGWPGRVSNTAAPRAPSGIDAGPSWADFHGNDHRFQLKTITDFILGDHDRSEATLAF
jgi:hypothetical protein